MKKKVISIKIVLTAAVIVLIFSTAAFAVQSTINEKKTDRSKDLTDERIMELYKEGYALDDIAKAKELSKYCSKSPEEILKIKGVREYNITRTNSPAAEITKKQLIEYKENKTTAERIEPYDIKIDDASKAWDSVISELGIDKKKLEEEQSIKRMEDFGVPHDRISELTNLGLSEKQMVDITMMAKEYQKDFDEVLGEVKKDRKTEELVQQYRGGDSGKNKALGIDEKALESKYKSMLSKKFNVTEEDIKKCNEKGITKIQDIAYAKKISAQSGLQLEQVIEKKSGKRNWMDVEKEAGGVE